ncbi:hypothetical protein KP78_26350 [Jeotgalibacillus soli]|uniref:Uncharacterized protein n=1 Tax=Jeotgalibacillus soli TaxID=889306 RepID=A0A0C2VKX2_9BACL|nr:hypothetical protein KP78_26350 [Jeotgalibacillus soli]
MKEGFKIVEGKGRKNISTVVMEKDAFRIDRNKNHSFECL